MKRNFRSLYMALALVTAIAGTSCKKYIDEAPITSTYDSKFWTSETSANQATLAMYKQLRDCFRADRSYFVNGDLTTGMFLPAASQWNYETISTARQYDFSYVPYLEGSLKNWARFYKLIAQANLILERVPQMPVALFGNNEAAKNRYIGEALFMRAYVYFHLTRVWGDPVYISKTYNNIDYGNIPPVPRSPEDEVLDSCISDLKRAATMLSFDGPAASLRVNNGAVHALLAHVYAWKGDYANAHAACQEVITKGGYGLESMASYKSIWAGTGSGETIFELAMKFNENGSEHAFDFFATFLKDAWVDNQTNNCWVADKSYIERLFQPEDLRFQNVLEKVNASGGDEEGYLMLKYTNFKYVTPTTKAGRYINNNLVLFRLADIYLLDAEALAMQGDGGAVTALNTVRERAGTGPYTGAADKTTLVTEVLEERGRELMGEGLWFYDMIRTQPVTRALEEWLAYQPDRITDKGYYWPIDMSVLFKTNPLLNQNPWWAKH